MCSRRYHTIGKGLARRRRSLSVYSSQPQPLPSFRAASFAVSAFVIEVVIGCRAGIVPHTTPFSPGTVPNGAVGAMPFPLGQPKFPPPRARLTV